MIKILRFLIPILVPVFLLMSSIRILFNPFFLDLEYHSPSFPADSYGFTVDDRMKWGILSLQYITTNAPITALSDLTFPDGSPLYNERELSHMDDVQRVYQRMVLAWMAIGALLLGLFGVAWSGKWLSDYGRMLSTGGMVTLLLILAVLVAVATSFNALFGAFHSLFFESGTWVFYYSDTLIRLYPVRLWQDSFIWAGVLTAAGGILLIVGGSLLTRRASKIHQAA